MSTTQPDQDERLLGALVHASVVVNVFNLSGMLAATLIWATQRERSRFVRDHALQALAYQAAVLLGLTLMFVLWGGCMALALLPALLRPDLYADGGPPAPVWVVLASLVVPLALSIAAALYGLYAAYQVFRGRPFRYPLVGRLVGAHSAQRTAHSEAPGGTPNEEAAHPPPPLIMPPPSEAQGGERTAQNEAPSPLQPPSAASQGEKPQD